MLNWIVRLFALLLLALLAPWATNFYYPTFLKRVRSLDRFLHAHQQDLLQLNGITDPELTQLINLSNATEQIGGRNSTWPKYRPGI